MHCLNNSRNRSRACGLVIIGLAAISGCNHQPAIAHVKGKVTFKNGPMPNTPVRMVRFEPADKTSAEVRRGASSLINPDGTYELWTKKPGDGVLAGTYDVTFAVQKGPMDPTSLIPAEYSNRATTPYKNLNVDKDQDGLDFEVDLNGVPGTPKT